jgi:hypothetical protein
MKKQTLIALLKKQDPHAPEGLLELCYLIIMLTALPLQSSLSSARRRSSILDKTQNQFTKSNLLVECRPRRLELAHDTPIPCRASASSHGRSHQAPGMAASCAGARQHSTACCLPLQRSKTSSLATRLECIWSASRMYTSFICHVFQPHDHGTRSDRNHSSCKFVLCLLRVCVAWLECSFIRLRKHKYGCVVHDPGRLRVCFSAWRET